MATTLERARPALVSPPTRPVIPAAPALNPYRWIILVAVLTGAFLELLDTTSVNVALPQMAGNLGATPDEIGWVATGYILSNVVVLPLTAWLSSVFGRRRYLTFSILLFTVASLFCGASTTLAQLIAWRIIQGAGGAALLSTAQATLREVFPAEQQGMVQALYILVVVVGPTLGPTFGGYMTDNYSWPWIFYIKSPLGLIAAGMVWQFLSDSPHQKKGQRVDWQGISLLAVGLGSLQYVLEEGERYDWFDDPTITRLAWLALVTLIAFVVWELWPTNRAPVVNLRVLKNKDLSAGTLVLLVGGFGIYAGTFIMPLLAENVLGFTPTETGLIFLPGGLATIIGTILCGRLLNGAKPLVKPPILILLGMILFSVSQWFLGHLTPQSGAEDAALRLVLRGAGLGLLLTPITVASLSTLKGLEIAQGAGLTNLARQLGGSMGIAVINTFVTTQVATHRVDLVGFVFSGSAPLQERRGDLTRHFITAGYSPTGAQAASIGVLNHTIQTQAQMMAYNDAFLLIGVAFLLALPAVVLFLRRKPVAGAPVDLSEAGH
jgi:DHA2 family multidrug resistance protein